VSFNPLSHGAVGDGVTDDTAAFKTMLTAIPTFTHNHNWGVDSGFNQGGGVVSLEKRFLIADTLQIPGGITWDGNTWGLGGIVFRPPTPRPLFIGDPSRLSRGIAWTWACFKNVYLAGDILTTNNQNTALDLTNFQRFALENVLIEGFGIGLVQGGASYYNVISHCEFTDNLLHIDQRAGAGPTNVIGGVFYHSTTNWANAPIKPNEQIIARKQMTFDAGVAFEPGGSVDDPETFVCIRTPDGGGVALNSFYSESPYPILEYDWDTQYFQHSFNPTKIDGVSGVRYKNFDLPEETPDFGTAMSAPFRTSWGGGRLTSVIDNPDFRVDAANWVLSPGAAYDQSGGFLVPGGAVTIAYTSTDALQTHIAQTISSAKLSGYRGRRLFFGLLAKHSAASEFRFQVQNSPFSSYKMARSPFIDYGNGWGLYVITFSVPTDNLADLIVLVRVTPENLSADVSVAGIFCWINGIDEMPVYETLPA